MTSPSEFLPATGPLAGLKVLEKSASQLALAFKQGVLHALDDGPLFERALAAVVDNLRQLNRGK